MAGPVLITGATGQLGISLKKASGERSVYVADRIAIDFNRPRLIGALVEQLGPRAIINAAAYTSVDKAEAEREAAYSANRDGPEILANCAAHAGIPFVHVSTDYVFDGEKGSPYTEVDRPSPTGVYGASKLAGEEAVLAIGGKNIILRTAWLYSPWGRNFLRTMLERGARNQRIRVVNDQTGCPTSAHDLAVAIWTIVDKIALDGWRHEFGGVFHAVGSGATTWHGFATAIFAEAVRYGVVVSEVEAICTESWPTPTKRPPDSRLDCTKLAATFGMKLPAWRDGLTRAISEYFAGTATRS
jgi:dTDP-4-dehydrorhamnose reductase